MQTSSVCVEDLAYTLSVRRTHHPCRAAFRGASGDELLEQMNTFIAESVSLPGVPNDPQRHTPAFVFSGMGSQWLGMGMRLMDAEPVFARTARACDAVFSAHSGWSILDVISHRDDPDRIHHTDIAQPAIVLVQAALCDLWRSWGILPDAVVGHSLGELSAAYAAGMMDHEALMAMVYHRSRLQARLAGRGGMLAVGMPLADVKTMLADYEDRIFIVAINGPENCTLSGVMDDLQKIAEQVGRRNIFCRFLNVDVPYHSDVMEEIRAEFLSSIEGLSIHDPITPFYSSLTAEKN